MTLTFNIIFTAGTVIELRAFAWSIVRHGDCNLRLVANGLAADEERVLRRFAGADRRLCFHRHDTREMAEHGDVLNALLALESGEYFAFMDSDVFAVAPFVPQVLAGLAEAAAVFAGVPVWATEADQIAAASTPSRYGGPQNRLSTGACLGTSYFAVYRAAVLRSFIAAHGVGLEKVKQARDLPAGLREQLAGIGGLVDGYETAKALNLLLWASGHDLRLLDLPAIQHVGGLSLLAKKRSGGRPYLADGEDSPRGFANRDKPWIARKRTTCQYLSAIVAALARGEAGPAALPELPQWPAQDASVRERVLALAPQLVELYAGFRRSGLDRE